VQADGAGINIIGVSANSIADHQRFRANQKLNFPLVSDIDGKMCAAFGACPNFTPGLPNFLSRVAFLVNADGTITNIYNIEGPEEQISALMDWVTTK
jgi:peroxiredoxin Q/BCP